MKTKPLILFFILMFLLGVSSSLTADNDIVSADYNSIFLPEDLTVYVNNNMVVNRPVDGWHERTLPTVNWYEGVPGCYIAAYSHDAEKGRYSVGGNIYVMGMVRVPGQYDGRICQPEGHEGQDISAMNLYKTLFTYQLDNCDGNCWAGGDTGGFFGIE